MCIRDPGSQRWSAPPGLTFREWLRAGVPAQNLNGSAGAANGPAPGLRPPTRDDLEYHLSTLFPPVRPRGHLELRMIDAQPEDGWVVPAAVTAALLDDPVAADAALAAAEPIWARGSTTGADGDGSPWLRAARDGPADPRFGQAIRACFEAADAALSRSAANEVIIRAAVADFAERYVLRARCPADDRLDALAGLGSGRRPTAAPRCNGAGSEQSREDHDANTEDHR
jgi:glutamate--cysteine ligase